MRTDVQAILADAQLATASTLGSVCNALGVLAPADPVDVAKARMDMIAEMAAELGQAAVELTEAANIISREFPRVATLYRAAADKKLALIAKATGGVDA